MKKKKVNTKTIAEFDELQAEDCIHRDDETLDELIKTMDKVIAEKREKERNSK